MKSRYYLGPVSVILIALGAVAGTAIAADADSSGSYCDGHRQGYVSTWQEEVGGVPGYPGCALTEEAAHRGYQQWHRNLDTEVAGWIRNNPNATPAQFENYLRRVYQRPDILERFPNGL